MRSGLGPDDTKGQSGIVRAALLGLCPRCGGRTLFEAPARVALTCSDCSLDFTRLERGGRFAGLLTAVIAVILIMIAFAVDEALRPPLWLHVVFWAPVTVGLVLFTLRLFKTVMVFAAYERSQEKGE